MLRYFKYPIKLQILLILLCSRGGALWVAFDPTLPIDGKIWIPVMIFPYMLSVVYWYVIPFVVYLVWGRKSFYFMVLTSFICYSFTFIFVVLVPTYNNIYPTADEINNYHPWYDWIFRLVYARGLKSEPIATEFPSYHVLNSTVPIVGVFFAGLNKKTIKKWILLSFMIFASLLTWISTFLIRAHYIADGLGSYLFIVISTLISFLIIKLKKSNPIISFFVGFNIILGVEYDNNSQYIKPTTIFKNLQNKTSYKGIHITFSCVLMLFTIGGIIIWVICNMI
ncbi:MAG: phosphatase PAP2 family protein [Mycoplasmataceae bacterium]|jgi:membrane-associated phospholipid phosphatase|nr:phosphatase PAP2 family protein [Mycoplasmataceae bacterium]